MYRESSYLCIFRSLGQIDLQAALAVGGPGRIDMATAGCILFGFRMLKAPDVANKKVLEVGSKDVNGSLRPILEALQPKEYVGVDIEAGAGVDRILGADQLAEDHASLRRSGMLEHVRDWRSAVSNLKRVCRRKGTIIISTRSIGFGYHAYPSDFWRYEPDDIRAIFSDMELVVLERDAPQSPGVMAKIRKPNEFWENDLTNLRLYSMIDQERISDVDDRHVDRFLRLMRYRKKISQLAAKLVTG